MPRRPHPRRPHRPAAALLAVALLAVAGRGCDALASASGERLRTVSGPVGVAPVSAAAPAGATVAVTGVGGVDWHQAPAASDPGASLWWGEVLAGRGNGGPLVLLVPGGGGQITEAVGRQAAAYAAAGLRVVVTCIATVAPEALPGPPTSCPRTRAATPGSLAAAQDVARLVTAVELAHPEVAADPARLVVVGDSYGGAAVLQAAALTGWRHPVVTLNGTTTWRGAVRPLVAPGDLDPADPALLARLVAPVVQVVGLDDPIVPPGVGLAFAARAEAAGRHVPVVAVVGVDHGEAFDSPPGACVHRMVAAVVRALAAGRHVPTATACR